MTRLATKMVLLAGVAGLAMTGAAGAKAAAAMQIDAPTLVVRYSGDALATDRGARILYSRLARAAEQVCPNEPSNSPLVGSTVLKCRREALTAAVNKIHNQRLAALDASRNSKSKSG